MTVVSSTDFATNQDKYFDLVDMNIFHDASVYEEVLEPDDDFRSAITGEELLTGIYKDLEKFFCQ